MMKKSTKRLLASLGLLLLLIAAIWGITKIAAIVSPGETLMAFIPSDSKAGGVVAAIGVNNLIDTYSLLSDSAFYQALKDSLFYEEYALGKSLENSQDFSMDFSIEDIENVDFIRLIGKKAILAFYGNPSKGYSFLLLSRMGDFAGIKEFIYKASLSEDNISETYKDVPLSVFSEGLVYAYTGEHIIVSNNPRLIKDSVDLIKGGRGSLHSVHPWMEANLKKNPAGFAYISYKEASKVMGPLANLAFWTEYAFYEFEIDKGIISRSFHPDSQACYAGEKFRTKALELIPRRPILAGAVTGVDPQAEYLKIKSDKKMSALTGIASENLNVSRDIVPLLGSRFAFALMGPSDDFVGSSLPVFMLLAEAADSGSLEKLYDLSSDILGVDMQEKEYSNKKYMVAEFPLFLGQSMEIYSIPVKKNSEDYLAITSSQALAEDLIDLSLGKATSLKKSPEWKEIS
ncbi:MAG: hypothetical protein GX817_01075, partial [Elusimicrobia bacterium]|nr:hypothetical protein [Elusimicrobiota bacterium]